MTKLTLAQTKKIISLTNKLIDIQSELYSFPNDNAGLAAFEIDAAINILENYHQWYNQSKSRRR